MQRPRVHLLVIAALQDSDRPSVSHIHQTVVVTHAPGSLQSHMPVKCALEKGTSAGVSGISNTSSDAYKVKRVAGQTLESIRLASIHHATLGGGVALKMQVFQLLAHFEFTLQCVHLQSHCEKICVIRDHTGMIALTVRACAFLGASCRGRRGTGRGWAGLVVQIEVAELELELVLRTLGPNVKLRAFPSRGNDK